MKIDGGKRLIAEDFSSDDKQLVNKLGLILNPFTEQITQALRKNLTIADNLNMELKKLIIQVDAGGIPISANQLQTVISNASGITIIRAINLTNTIGYPTGNPFCTFVQKSNIIEIQHVTGLTPNDKWQLTLQIIGI